MGKNLSTPFDDSAPRRLQRMGLLTAEGIPNQEALAAIERLYAGLFYDALCDASDDVDNIIAVCSGISERIESGNPKQSFLKICLAYDTISHPIPEPVWWMAGNMELIAHFSVGFVKQLTDLLQEVG